MELGEMKCVKNEDGEMWYDDETKSELLKLRDRFMVAVLPATLSVLQAMNTDEKRKTFTPNRSEIARMSYVIADALVVYKLTTEDDYLLYVLKKLEEHLKK